MFPDEDAHPYTLYEPYAKTIVGTPEHITAYDVGPPSSYHLTQRFYFDASTIQFHENVFGYTFVIVALIDFTPSGHYTSALATP